MYLRGYIFLIINFIVVACQMTSQEQESHHNFHLLPDEDCSKTIQAERIVGGYETDIGQYPWIAQIGYSLDNCPGYTKALYYDCGSSLITPSSLLTAAHCIDMDGKSRCPTTHRHSNIKVGYVKLGEWNQNHDGRDCMGSVCADEAQVIAVKRAKMHEHYDKDEMVNDIAIIILKKPAKITDWVNPVCMPAGGMLSESLRGHSAEVIGWGRTSNYASPSDKQGKLKSVNVPIKSQRKCSVYFSWHGPKGSPDSIICAGGDSGKDSCNGDSGGPLLLLGKVNNVKKKFLVGLVSFGPPHCGSRGKPAVYTRITYFMEWILDNLS